MEVPIDIQAALIDLPDDLEPLAPLVAVPAAPDVARLADALAQARRPLLWVGGGARGAGPAVARLIAMGFGVVSSTQGRGIVAETHAQSLGAYNVAPPVEAFYATCDALLVVGSRRVLLRGDGHARRG